MKKANENIDMHNVTLLSYTWNEIIKFLNEWITWWKIMLYDATKAP